MDEIPLVEDNMDALMFTKNNCTNCDSSKELMDELDVKYTVINIDENPEARATIKKMGYRQAPVIVTRDAKWSGHNEREIRDLASGGSIWD